MQSSQSLTLAPKIKTLAPPFEQTLLQNIQEFSLIVYEEKWSYIKCSMLININVQTLSFLCLNSLGY